MYSIYFLISRFFSRKRNIEHLDKQIAILLREASHNIRLSVVCVG
jgi:hypothetical protein